MIIISFGRWSYAAGKRYVRERIYTKKRHAWTPFVRVRRRYVDPETACVIYNGTPLGTPQHIHEALTRFMEALHLWNAFLLVNKDVEKRWKEFKNVSGKSKESQFL